MSHFRVAVKLKNCFLGVLMQTDNFLFVRSFHFLTGLIFAFFWNILSLSGPAGLFLGLEYGPEIHNYVYRLTTFVFEVRLYSDYVMQFEFVVGWCMVFW